MSSSSSQQRSRELHGPRPAPLRVHKGSHTIRKQQRQPVIIYTLSPKVVHANPADFMSVVQRLTGAASLPPQLPPPPSLPPAPLPFPFQFSPAARLASIEQARSIAAGHPAAGRAPLPPGILQSPMLPPSSFSSPATTTAGDTNLFGELVSPAFHGHNAGSSSAAPHPMQQLQNLAAPAASTSPYPYYHNWDLFNNHPADS